jgi:hypothetical protein
MANPDLPRYVGDERPLERAIRADQQDTLTIPFWRFMLLVLRDQCRFSDLFGPWRRQAESEQQRRIRLATAAITLAEKILDIEPKERELVVARALILAKIGENQESETFAS